MTSTTDAPTSPTHGAKVHCAKHGMSLWQGHVECSNCRAVFQTRRVLGARSAPSLCICGLPLMPKPMTDNPHASPFTARCLCAACYAERVPEAAPAPTKGASP